MKYKYNELSLDMRKSIDEISRTILEYNLKSIRGEIHGIHFFKTCSNLLAMLESIISGFEKDIDESHVLSVWFFSELCYLRYYTNNKKYDIEIQVVAKNEKEEEDFYKNYLEVKDGYLLPSIEKYYIKLESLLNINSSSGDLYSRRECIINKLDLNKKEYTFDKVRKSIEEIKEYTKKIELELEQELFEADKISAESPLVKAEKIENITNEIEKNRQKIEQMTYALREDMLSSYDRVSSDHSRIRDTMFFINTLDNVKKHEDVLLKKCFEKLGYLFKLFREYGIAINSGNLNYKLAEIMANYQENFLCYPYTIYFPKKGSCIHLEDHNYINQNILQNIYQHELNSIVDELFLISNKLHHIDKIKYSSLYLFCDYFGKPNYTKSNAYIFKGLCNLAESLSEQNIEHNELYTAIYSLLPQMSRDDIQEFFPSPITKYIKDFDMYMLANIKQSMDKYKLLNPKWEQYFGLKDYHTPIMEEFAKNKSMHTIFNLEIVNGKHRINPKDFPTLFEDKLYKPFVAACEEVKKNYDDQELSSFQKRCLRNIAYNLFWDLASRKTKHNDNPDGIKNPADTLMNDNSCFTKHLSLINKNNTIFPRDDVAEYQAYYLDERAGDIFADYDYNNFDDKMEKLSRHYHFKNKKAFNGIFEAIDDMENPYLLVEFLYFASRDSSGIKDGMLSIVGLNREIQKEHYPVKKYREKVSALDFGFEAKDYRMQIFPFTTDEILNIKDLPVHNKYITISRDIAFKFICEVDEQADLFETLKIAMGSRYLYKDRNSIVHYDIDKHVNSLLNRKNCLTLMRILDEARTTVFLKPLQEHLDFWAQRGKAKSVISKNPIAVLMLHFNSLFNRTIDKLRDIVCENYSEIKKPKIEDKSIFDSYVPSFVAAAEQYIKESNVKLEGKYEKELEHEIKNLLNIVFSVNGSNEYGRSKNISQGDVWLKYQSEIITYMFAFLFGITDNTFEVKLRKDSDENSES